MCLLHAAFYLVLYGVSIVGPCRADGLCGYGGGPAPCAAHALLTARVAGSRGVEGCVRWSAWKPMGAFKTPVR